MRGRCHWQFRRMLEPWCSSEGDVREMAAQSVTQLGEPPP